MSHHTVIVYRNPAEAAFWESGIAFPWFCGVLAALAVCIIGAKVLESLPYSLRNNRWIGMLYIASIAVAGGGTIWYMMI